MASMETKIAVAGSEPASKRPVDTDFQQQRLRAWQPLLTPLYVIVTFAAIGVLFIVLGIVVLAASSSVVETEHVRYDQQVPLGVNASVSVTIPNDMTSTVYFYYELANFYQNHRRYVKSRSDGQLKGSSNPDLSTCEPLERNNNSVTLYPCGLIANSKFNDEFSDIEVTRASGTIDYYSGNPASTGSNAFWTNTNIAWKSDRTDKFAYPPNPIPNSQTNISPLTGDAIVIDEELMVWMRTAGLPKFKKLHRIVNSNVNLKAGDVVKFKILNKFPVSSFNGSKYVLFSTTSWLGGKNEFLGYAYIVVACICLFLAIAFTIKHKVSPRPLGDMKYFNWPGAAIKSSN